MKISKLDKRIAIVGSDGDIFKISVGAWTEFFQSIDKNGLETNQNMSDPCNYVVNLNYTPRGLSKALEVPLENRVLIVMEPECVIPEQYQEKIYRNFGKIYTLSIEWAAKFPNAKSTLWPQGPISIFNDDFDTWNHRRENVILVQANKLSATKGELYSLRRSCISILGDKIDVYGENWNLGLRRDFPRWVYKVKQNSINNINLRSASKLGLVVSNYYGKVEDKHALLRNYKYCLVIENSADYVSEKLFDSISAGCITFYVGPNLSKFNLDQESVIALPRNARKIKKILSNFSKLDPKIQWKVAKTQNQKLLELESPWGNSLVLGELGNNIAKDLLAN